MKSATLAQRKAFNAALNGQITYLGKNIATFENYVQKTATRQIALLEIGVETVQAYIILLNQTSNDASFKCVRNNLNTIQIQITTVWDLNKGGSEIAELIGELVTDELFTDDGLFNKMAIAAPFKIWKGILAASNNISYHTSTNSVWITQLTIQNEITQTAIEVENEGFPYVLPFALA